MAHVPPEAPQGQILPPESAMPEPRRFSTSVQPLTEVLGRSCQPPAACVLAMRGTQSDERRKERKKEYTLEVLNLWTIQARMLGARLM